MGDVDDDEGVVCTDCGEWFEVWFNTAPWNWVRYCPLCGHKFSKKELEIRMNV